MSVTAALADLELQAAVQREIARAGGDLDLAILIVGNDACECPGLRDLHNLLLAERSARKALDQAKAA